MKILLSNLLKNVKEPSLNNVIEYMNHLNVDTIVNDLSAEPYIEYDITDLEIIWDNILKKLNLI
jgi:hypothetical protein